VVVVVVVVWARCCAVVGHHRGIYMMRYALICAAGDELASICGRSSPRRGPPHVLSHL
jgi:hypothetical protein